MGNQARFNMEILTTIPKPVTSKPARARTNPEAEARAQAVAEARANAQAVVEARPQANGLSTREAEARANTQEILPGGACEAIRKIISSHDAMELTARLVRQKALLVGIDLSSHKKQATAFMMSVMNGEEEEEATAFKVSLLAPNNPLPQLVAMIPIIETDHEASAKDKKSPLKQRPTNAPEPQKRKRAKPVTPKPTPKDNSAKGIIEADTVVKRMKDNLKACGVGNHFSVNSIAAKSDVEYDDTTVKGVTAKLKYVLDYYELPTSRKVTAEESEKFIALRELKQLQETTDIMNTSKHWQMPTSKRTRRPANHEAPVPLSEQPQSGDREEPVVKRATNIAGWNSDESDSE